MVQGMVDPDGIIAGRNAGNEMFFTTAICGLLNLKKFTSERIWYFGWLKTSIDGSLSHFSDVHYGVFLRTIKIATTILNWNLYKIFNLHQNGQIFF